MSNATPQIECYYRGREGLLTELWVVFSMPDPFRGFGLYDLDDRCRLCLPKGLEAYVKWFNPTEIQDCLAVPGRRGLVLFPPAILEEHRKMMVQLENGESRPEDIGSVRFELARTGTVTWAVTIGTDRRFQLPLGARELGIVPATANASVAVVVFRGVIEVWHPSELLEQIQDSAARWTELKARGVPRSP